MESAVQPHRIGYIDGLRAIAVLTVVWSHAYGSSAIGQSFGVDLFFVISGFCLSYPTLERLRSQNAASFDVFRYAARRVVRIVPPYWIAIVVLFGVSFFVTSPPALVHVSVLDVIYQALFLDQKGVLLTNPFWSLPVELRWYFLFPIALLLWTKSPRAFIAVAVAVTLAAAATRATNVDMVMLPAFLLGIVAAHIQVYGHKLTRFALPACAIMIALAYWRSGLLVNPLWELAVFLFAVGAGSWLWLRRALSLRVITFIGLTSYSIYLVHAPIVAIALDRGVDPRLAMILAVAGGIAFWAVAERPFVDSRLRDKLVADYDQIFAKWLPRIGIGGSMRLAASAAPSEVGVGDVAVRLFDPVRDDAVGATTTRGT